MNERRQLADRRKSGMRSQLDLDDEEQKRIVKEAIHEWLDEIFAAVGRWSLGGLTSAALAWGVYGWLKFHGWVHK